MERIYIFPSLGDELKQVVTNKHSIKLLAAYQVLVDDGVFESVVVNELPIGLARKLYPKVFTKLNITSHHQTGGIEINKTDTDE